MGSKSADAPNYAGAAVAEGEAARELNEAATYANRPTQINPWGTVEWGVTPTWDPATQQYVNDWTQTTTLDPKADAALQNEMQMQQERTGLAAGMMGDLGNNYSQAVDWSKYGDQTQIGGPQYMTTEGLNDRISDVGTTNYNPEALQRNINYGDQTVQGGEYQYQQAADSMYNQAKSRLDPQFDSEQKAMEIKLANQGLQAGDAAYDAQINSLNQRKTDAYGSAQNNAYANGMGAAQGMFGMDSSLRDMNTGEADRMANFYNTAAGQQFGMNSSAQQQAFQDRLAAGNFSNAARDQGYNERLSQLGYNTGAEMSYADWQNNARQQAMNEELMQRGTRLNEVNALISGQQVGTPQFQGFNQAGTAATPQMLQAAGMQGQQAAADASASNAMMGNLIGGAATAYGGGMFSDRRLKKNIKRIGEHQGHNIYSYTYLWGVDGVGVMADEIPEKYRIRVGEYDMVDYGGLFG